METQETLQSDAGAGHSLKICDWLWRPLYARLWLCAVPFYWGGMAASSRVEFFATFYSSAISGFVNVFFFPPVVALILSYGFFKAWLATAKFEPNEQAEEFLVRRRNRYGPSGMLREFDPLDPTSGAMWVGNPLNPSNPGYINRHSS